LDGGGDHDIIALFFRRGITFATINNQQNNHIHSAAGCTSMYSPAWPGLVEDEEE
jgi:hypothetical protein